MTRFPVGEEDYFVMWLNRVRIQVETWERANAEKRFGDEGRKEVVLDF
jgi:hypothetical protein